MNTDETARRWTEFLASRTEIPGSQRLLDHFNAGTITRICDCGCNSYDIKVPHNPGLTPLLTPRGHGRGGCVLSMAFKFSNREGSLEIDLFADSDGYLEGVDVSCNANSEPVPDNPQLFEPPYHIDGALLHEPDNA
jgi:hypothetical protein